MDEIDLLILNELLKDARKSLSEISNKINLSLPAVSERVKKLERNNIIERYTAVLNPEKFGKMLSCFCFLNLNSKNSHCDEIFNTFIQKENDILECHCITGEYQYFLKILTENTRTLEALLIRIRNQTAVVRSSTFISLSTQKESSTLVPHL